MLRFLVGALLLLSIRTQSAIAQQQPPLPDEVLIFDFLPNANGVANRSFGIKIDKQNAGDIQLVEDLRNPRTTGSKRQAIIESIRAEHDATTKARTLAGQRAIVQAFAFHAPSEPIRIKFSETERESRITTDIRTLGILASKIAAAADRPAGRDTSIAVSSVSYTLTLVRATLGVTAAPAAPPQPAGGRSGGAAGAGAPATVTPGPGRGTAPNDESERSAPIVMTLVTGPAEHFFLSANAGAAALSGVEYDDETGTLTPAEAPSSFFISANYAFADILSSPGDGVLDLATAGLYVGVMAEASRRPMDQVGLILGFIHNPIWPLSKFISFETVSPFVGVAWQRSDKLEADGTVKRRARYGKGSFIYGVSLNLSKAVDVMVPKKKASGDEGSEEGSGAAAGEAQNQRRGSGSQR